MTIGSYALSIERIAVLSYSKSYMQNSFVFAYIRNIVFSTPLMAPFQNCMWISIASLLFISIIIILMSKKLSTRQRHFIIGGRLNRTPILNMINVLFGNVVANRQMTRARYFGIFARTLMILWIMFWLIVRNSYQGALYGFLQTQRKNFPYDTVDKVRHSNVKIYIMASAGSLISQTFGNER